MFLIFYCFCCDFRASDRQWELDCHRVYLPRHVDVEGPLRQAKGRWGHSPQYPRVSVPPMDQQATRPIQRSLQQRLPPRRWPPHCLQVGLLQQLLQIIIPIYSITIFSRERTAQQHPPLLLRKKKKTFQPRAPWNMLQHIRLLLIYSTFLKDVFFFLF